MQTHETPQRLPHPITVNPVAWQREADRLAHEIARAENLGNRFQAACLRKTRAFALDMARRA